ncbi:hypothetical protein Bhyg_16429 [Pseudolycoriella hygida]|uniref:Uncharacterized protein n=1 Tax=Pseudolycoriella hygida TaxID=35572 RepID=A0A9Q0RV41_9DIPT|nr:hypothetical protein Bhyg_16429 [Pseudolycoriella hygida]
MINWIFTEWKTFYNEREIQEGKKLQSEFVFFDKSVKCERSDQQVQIAYSLYHAFPIAREFLIEATSVIGLKGRQGQSVPLRLRTAELEAVWFAY